MKLILGTKSALKVAALQTALAELGLEATILSVSAASGVEEQPVGQEETLCGARHRAQGAREQDPSAIAIGIENGIQLISHQWRDWAVIVFLLPSGAELVVHSDDVAMPTDLVEEARLRGFATTTVGSLIAAKYGCPSDDPHSFLTEGTRPRQRLLADALKEGLKHFSLERKKENAMKKVHSVTVNGVSRDLKIKEVKPGVWLAVFKPLGDWQLNEAAGKELAKRIPAGTEILVMPDGKAQALLHVMGRESGLPTVVARKVRKGYMEEPVLSVKVVSKTSDEQMLHMDADDAALLKGKRAFVVDDVVSTGASLNATRELIMQAGGEYVGVIAVYTEGDPRPDVIAYGHLPLF